jgi:heme/copper-type cytochrome/quinol oxidase subunit 4
MEINKKIFRDTFGWGFLLWLFGYIFGIVLFMVAPTSSIGWIITPIATIITLWVLIKKIKSASFQYYLIIGIIWTILAIILDYFLIVKAFKPEDGYYKLDVYLYYALTFLLPLLIGLRKQGKSSNGKMV